MIDEEYTRAPFYGVRRLTERLRRLLGEKINHKRVHRLMQLMGISAIYPKKRLSQGNKNQRKYPYLLEGVRIERVNQVWSTDITYIPMASGYLYLVAILDWYSRYVISWELSNTLETGFCLIALERALDQGKPEIFNSDQGVQFTSDDFTVSGTALGGTDYTSIGTTVGIAANAVTGTVTVAPVNDTTAEPDETVTLTLAAGTGYNQGAPNTATVTIVDDDPLVAPNSLAVANTTTLRPTYSWASQAGYLYDVRVSLKATDAEVRRDVDISSPYISPIDLALHTDYMWRVRSKLGTRTGYWVWGPDFTIDDLPPPVITRHPANVTVTESQTATFCVTASGSEPLTYQWLKNNAPIAGATGGSYTTPATTAADSGATFKVIVTNSAGSVTSHAALLIVQTDEIFALPAPIIVPNGGTFVDPLVVTITPGPLSTLAATPGWLSGVKYGPNIEKVEGLTGNGQSVVALHAETNSPNWWTFAGASMSPDNGLPFPIYLWKLTDNGTGYPPDVFAGITDNTAWTGNSIDLYYAEAGNRVFLLLIQNTHGTGRVTPKLFSCAAGVNQDYDSQQLAEFPQIEVAPLAQKPIRVEYGSPAKVRVLVGDAPLLNSTSCCES